MAQTLNFDVAINQGQITSAVQQVQSGIATQLQAGALQMSGMASGMANMMGSMQTAAGPHHAGQGIAYAMSTAAVARGLSRTSFEDRASKIEGFINNSMGVVRTQAQQAAIKFTDLTIPRQPGVAATLGGGIARTAMQWAPYAGFMAAGGAVAKGVLGAGLGASVLGGALGMFALPAIAAPVLGKMTGLTDAIFGTNAPKPGTPAWAKQVSGMKKDLQFGSAVSTIYGVKFGLGGLHHSKEKAWMSAMQKVGKSIRSSKIPGLEGASPMDVAGMFMTSSMTYGGPLGDAVDTAKRQMQNTGRVSRAASENIISAARKDAQFSSERAGRLGVSPGGKRHMMLEHMLMMPTAKNRSIDPWKILGERMGTQYQVGKGVGRDLSIKYTKQQARTDLLLSREEKKWVGGSLGAGAAHMQSALGNVQMGQPGYMAMAAMTSGRMPRKIYDLPYAAASIMSDPVKALEFQTTYNKTLKKAGGKGISAAFRWHAMGLAEMAQNFGPYKDVDPYQITTAQIQAGVFDGGKPQSLVSSQARSAQIHHRGNAIVRNSGRGQGIADLVMGKKPIAGFLHKGAMDAIDAKMGKGLDQGARFNALKAKNYDRYALNSIVGPDGGGRNSEIGGMIVLAKSKKGLVRSDLNKAQKRIFDAAKKYGFVDKFRTAKDARDIYYQFGNKVVGTGLDAIPGGKLAAVIGGSASGAFRMQAKLRKLGVTWGELKGLTGSNKDENIAKIIDKYGADGDTASQLYTLSKSNRLKGVLADKNAQAEYEQTSSAEFTRLSKDKRLKMYGPDSGGGQKDKKGDLASQLANLTTLLRSIAMELKK